MPYNATLTVILSVARWTTKFERNSTDNHHLQPNFVRDFRISSSRNLECFQFRGATRVCDLLFQYFLARNRKVEKNEKLKYVYPSLPGVSQQRHGTSQVHQEGSTADFSFRFLGPCFNFIFQ